MADRDRVESFVRGRRDDLLAATAALRETGDAKAVHKLRVAVRRLRALLRAAESFFAPEWTERVRPELDRLGRAFGPLRDADVLAARIRGQNVDGDDLAPVLTTLDADRSALYASALTELDAPEFSELTAALDAPQLVDTDATLGGVVARELRKLRKTVAQADDDETLHRARIRAKRVRYVAEALGAKRVIERAKVFQDVAGAHQDAVVTEEKLRALAARLPESTLVLGRLIERERLRRTDTRRNVPKAWKRLERAAKAV